MKERRFQARAEQETISAIKEIAKTLKLTQEGAIILLIKNSAHNLIRENNELESILSKYL